MVRNNEHVERSRRRPAASGSAAQLSALNRAALTMTGDLEVDRVLRTILRTTARLVHARYGALGEPDGRGGFMRFLTVGIPEAQARKIGTLPRVHGVLGALVTKGRPIRVRDIRRHPEFSWYPDHHPDMRDFLGVPIRHRGVTVGNLFFAGSRRGAFSAADQRLVQMLAAHAGAAIASARLYATAQELAVLEERNRVARELHDAVSQTLFSMMYEARAARLQVGRVAPAAAATLDRLQAAAASALEEMRGLVFALRPKSLERDGLATTLADHVEALRRIHGARISLRIDGERRLSPDHEQALLRIAQEALHNALKHSHSPTIAVELRHDSAATQLRVFDRGVGFDVSALPRNRRSMGLYAMRERAAAIGARFMLEAAPGDGCSVRVVVPNGHHRR
jgi:signal transduction histidine kinase